MIFTVRISIKGNSRDAVFADPIEAFDTMRRLWEAFSDGAAKDVALTVMTEEDDSIGYME